MRKVLLAIAILMIPVSSFAADECPGCLLGIFDNETLDKNYGTWVGGNGDPAKVVWVGIIYDPATIEEFSGFTTVELSVSGLPTTIFGNQSFEGVPSPAITLGNAIETPLDEETGTGGVNMAWDSCIPGDRAFIKLSLLSFDLLGDDVVFRIRRKFPPGNPSDPVPLITKCDAPIFTAATMEAGCYVLNPTNPTPGTIVDGCELKNFTNAVEGITWSTLKSLYND